MDNFDKVLEKHKTNESYLSIIFGNKISSNCFDFGMPEENYLEFLRFIKNHEKWDLVSKENIKVFYYYDLKLTALINGKLTLDKDILLNYYDFLDVNDKGFRLMNYKKIDNMEVTIFPGLDKLHDIRKVREIIFRKNNIYIKFLVVNHNNKDITFESNIYCESKYKKEFIEVTQNLLKFFKLKDLTKFSEVEVENVDNLSLSVL